MAMSICSYKTLYSRFARSDQDVCLHTKTQSNPDLQ